MTTKLYDLNAHYPVECLREFSDGSLYYCIYKLKEGGLLYAFFQDKELSSARYVFIVKNLVTRDDFKDIQKGSSLSDVEAVDAGTKLIRSVKPDRILNTGFTLHIVKDGFVMIKYEVGAHDISQCKVESITFFDNGEEIFERRHTILQQDYPE